MVSAEAGISGSESVPGSVHFSPVETHERQPPARYVIELSLDDCRAQIDDGENEHVRLHRVQLEHFSSLKRLSVSTVFVAHLITGDTGENVENEHE